MTRGLSALLALTLLAAAPGAAAEGLYLELGLWHAHTGANIAGDADTKQLVVAPGGTANAPEAAPGPYGSLELGYTFTTSRGDTSIAAFHLSSVATQRDKGANFIGITHRFGGKD